MLKPKEIAKLAKDYTWTDGTKEAKRIKWKIVKGTNPLEVAPKTVTAKYKKVKKQDVKKWFKIEIISRFEKSYDKRFQKNNISSFKK